MNNFKLDENQLIAIMSCLLPGPSREFIEVEINNDRRKNPHGDNYKPPIRSPLQVDAELRVKQAKVILSQVNK